MNDSLIIKIEIKPGSNIPAFAIPDLIKMATLLDRRVSAVGNGVTIYASPGDDPIDLAVSWEIQLRKKEGERIAVAWEGRGARVKALAQEALKDDGKTIL